MKLPEEVEATWLCHRLIVEQRATWTEVTEKMSIDDVDLLGIALDIYFDATNTSPGGER